MIEGSSALKIEFIDNIPWQKSPAFIWTNDAQSYIDTFRNYIDKIPTKDLKISFTDDTWDFSPYLNNINSSELKFLFHKLPDELSEYCKFFVLYKIYGKLKISSTKVFYDRFSSIVLNIFKRTTHKNIHVITTEDIKNEINRRNVSPSTANGLYQAAYHMYYFLINHYKLNLPVELSVLNYEIKRWRTINENCNTKLSDIPEKYYNIILNTALSAMRNKNIETNERMIAAGIVLLSQTGLRLGDLLDLETESLHSKRLTKSGIFVSYIHYTARKPSKAHQQLLEFDIFCNRIGTEAFEIIRDLRKESRFSEMNNKLFLFIPANNSCATSNGLITKARFRSLYHSFMYNHLPVESTTKWKGIIPIKYHRNPYKEKNGTGEPITMYIPETRQYRVHLCTVLYNQGVPLIYIQKYMGHLSEHMMGYYVRPKDTYQENIQYSERIIREIADEDITPLGGNKLGKEIKENIQHFISNNGFNVHTDVNAIIQAMGDKIIIRGKTGGVCIKTSIMPCSKDARTNEVLCAYNLCPNLFHFYYMIEVSYANFMTLQDSFYAMKNTNKTKASQKELSKIKDLINRRLIPELNELDKEIERKGIDYILDRHPSLIEVIEHRDKIRKEIEVWRMKELIE